MPCSLLECILLLAMAGIELANGVDELRQSASMLAPGIGFDTADNIHSPGAEQVEGPLYIFRCESAGDDDRSAQLADVPLSSVPIKGLPRSAALCSARAVDQPRVRFQVWRSVKGRCGNRFQNSPTGQLPANLQQISCIFVAMQLNEIGR